MLQAKKATAEPAPALKPLPQLAFLAQEVLYFQALARVAGSEEPLLEAVLDVRFPRPAH